MLCLTADHSYNWFLTLSLTHMTPSSPDIPQVVLLTHVDQVCHAIQEDVKFVYSSRILQEKVG